MLQDVLDGPVLANKLEGALGAHVFDALREVCAEQKDKVDVARSIKVERRAHVRPGDEHEWF